MTAWNKNMKSPWTTKRNLENNPMKNPETRKKASLAHKGKKQSKEHIQNAILHHRNYQSEETKKKIGLANSGKNNHFYGVHNYGAANSMYEKDVSDETRRKISESNKGKPSPMKGEHHTEETKKKMKEARSKTIIPFKDTSIEVKIQNFLKLLGINFFTHQYMKIDHAYQCDILITIQPKVIQPIVIECYGDFFHCNPIKYSSSFIRFPNGEKIITAEEVWKLDNARTLELIEKGYKVLRLWENEIKVMQLDDFKNKIEVLK